jgi:hypothetical protein
MADERRALHAYLTPESHDAWHDFAAENGVSVSGMLEAYGLELVEIVNGAAKPRKDQQALVDQARKIDAVRRRRRRS